MDYIKIGKIINTHGIKGELKIQSYSDFDAQRYKKGNQVYVLYEGTYIPFQVATFRVHKGYPLVSFQNAENINAVEKFKESLLFMSAEDRTPLKKGEYYRDELIGMQVHDEEGNPIGTVSAVEETYPGQRHLRIARMDQADALVPYIPVFIKNVDKEQQIITIHVQEGLL
jgi:16S rRNA processing protein RimM